MAEDELEHLRRALETTQRLAHVGTWEYDIATETVYWSDEMFRLYGYEPGEITATRESSLERTHPDDHQLLTQWAEEMFAHPGEQREVDMRVLLPDGSERLVRQRAIFVTGDRGSSRLVGTVQDWTMEARSRQTETLLAQIVTSVSDAIYTVDTDVIVNTWNPGAERLYGYKADEIIGQSLDILYPDRRGRAWHEGLARRKRLFAGESDFEEYETLRRHKDGRVIEIALNTSPLRDHAGNVIGAIGSARDISERRRVEAQLAHYANHDVITGLFNRPRFEEELAAACLRAEQEGHPGAVLMLDLDNFRYINETHGHKTGDELVASLASALPRHLRDTDTLARFGGDEFAVLLAPCTEQAACALADELLRAVREHGLEINEGKRLRVSASIGVVTFSGNAATAQELLADVDRAMYQSKEAGRDRVTVVTPSERSWVREQLNHSSGHMIHSALDNDQFELYTQPIVDLTDGRMTHCEVLLRLNNDGTVIAPGQFLPAAERLGLIHLIDRWVIDRAFALASAHEDLVFELNLSGLTIDDDQLAAYVADRLNAHGTDPSRIVFEITETAAVGNIAKARDLAHRVSQLGCTFAIDDFGTGFSTFYYLKHFPAQYVKIDGEFLSDGQSRMDELVIESIVRIGRDLGKQTIAEYVSDEGRLERVRKLGVDYAQGFYLSEPFPATQLGSHPRQLLNFNGDGAAARARS